MHRSKKIMEIHLKFDKDVDVNEVGTITVQVKNINGKKVAKVWLQEEHATPVPLTGTLFQKLIQYPQPERLLKRLHELIDGENGAAVGSVLLKCMQLGYLKKTPTQAEYVSEFQLIGTWSAIHNYMDNNSWKALSRANKVIIFQD